MLNKRYHQANTQVDHKKSYPLPEAISVLSRMPKAKFNESVELSISLTIDPKQTDQLVRGTVHLPHGTGKTRRVLVFCKGEHEGIAKGAGADYVGGKEFIEKIQDGWLEFDVVVATPEMMREVSRLGKVLGPRGLMPNPKAGTVTEDVAKAIQDVQRGKIEFKMDKLSNIHLVIGKRAFSEQQLIENGQMALDAIVQARPSSTKGRLIRRASLSSTMSPGIWLDVETLESRKGMTE